MNVNINKIPLLNPLPSAIKLIKENNLNTSNISGTGKDGRVTKGDVLLYLKIESKPDINDSYKSSEKPLTKRKENTIYVFNVS